MGKGTDWVWHRENHTPSACLWSVHLDVDMFPFLVQEVTAYSNQPAELLQQSPPTFSPSSLHILHSKDLFWLKGRREALPQQFNWQPAANSNFLQAGCNKPLGAQNCDFFKNQDGKNQTK